MEVKGQFKQIYIREQRRAQQWVSIFNLQCVVQTVSELKECFILFDPNNKGAILGSDLGRALRAMGQNPSESDVTKMLQSAVLDGKLSCNMCIAKSFRCRVYKSLATEKCSFPQLVLAVRDLHYKPSVATCRLTTIGVWNDAGIKIKMNVSK